MRQIIEMTLDLTTQELLDLPANATLTKIDYICALDLAGDVANSEVESGAASAGVAITTAGDFKTGDAVEIELTLTPLEMDALLNGEWEP